MPAGESTPGRITVVAAQMAPRLRDKAANLDKIERWTRRAAANGARLIVFPECALSGYCYESLAEALEDAEPIPGPASTSVARLAAETGLYVVFGMVERAGDRIFNTAALIGPEGLVGIYRKTHLPWEAVDRFVTPGDLPFPVYDTAIGRIGMLICYDLRLPEPARIEALAGADIIVHPTNLPEGGRPQPDFMYPARASENHVWVVSADRVGEERGVLFIGRSAIVDPMGRRLAEGGEAGEELVAAEIEPAQAREKDLVIVPGVYELHLFRARRPELYGAILNGPGGPGGPSKPRTLATEGALSGA
ncbi:MAG: carbon-nitrogen hydrolase family protein [Gemmataceae bacterium]|nr:carbon-nitrogen hydrolase family protein [Gemmataceae bacterium]